MVIELTFVKHSREERKVKVNVEEFFLIDLIKGNETLIKLIRKEKKQDEILTGIRDLDI